MDETLTAIDGFIAAGGFHQIATANTDFVVKALHDPELKAILTECDLVVADGMPLVWASRLIGSALRERVTGADLLPRLAEASATKGHRLYLLGASPESSLAAADNLKRRYPGVKIVGRFAPPPASLDRMDNAEIIGRIRSARPDVLLVAFGNPKQEKWISRNRQLLEVPVCIGVGAAIDFAAGVAPRAPRWMQVSGVEWIHRLLNDPRRLGPRYLEDILQFGRYFSVQMRAHRSSGSGRTRQGLVRSDMGRCSVIHVHGILKGSSLARFEEAVRIALGEGQSIIADLSGASEIGGDALAAFIDLQHRNGGPGKRIRLVGVGPRFRETIRFGENPVAADRYPCDGVAAGPTSAEPTTEITLQLSGSEGMCRIAGQFTEREAELLEDICLQVTSKVTTFSLDMQSLSDQSRRALNQLAARFPKDRERRVPSVLLTPHLTSILAGCQPPETERWCASDQARDRRL